MSYRHLNSPRRHARLPEPGFVRQADGRLFWGPLPQLPPRTPPTPFLPHIFSCTQRPIRPRKHRADLRGERQRQPHQPCTPNQPSRQGNRYFFVKKNTSLCKDKKMELQRTNLRKFQASQNSIIRSSQNDLRNCDRRGLLWLLDEEALYPGSTDESFLERLFSHYGDRDHQLLLRKAPGNNQFILQHLQGTNPVLYTAAGWVKASKENPIARSAVTILQESSK